MATSRLGWSGFLKRARLNTFQRASFRPAQRFAAHPIPPLRSSVRYQSQWPFGQRPRYSRFEDYNRPAGGIGRLVQIWQNYPGVILGIGGLCGGFYVYNLETVEISGRRRFNVLSPKAEEALFQGQYESMIGEFKNQLLPVNHPYVRLCQRVVSRLVHANGLESQKWVVHVIDDDRQVNAFCMPGGQVFVFTGMLPVAKDEDGLAAVLGHEIAHKIARHHAEQLSGRIWALSFVVLASVFFDVSGNLSRYVYELMFNLRNSRTQEAEADQLGLLMMARSCYDPHAAAQLWERMAKRERDEHQSVPEFFSTHPASEHRIKNIEGWIPKALDLAAENDCSFTKGALDGFSSVFGGRGSRSKGFPTPVHTSGSSDQDWF